jgi:fimbrial chaperone protein
MGGGTVPYLRLLPMLLIGLVALHVSPAWAAAVTVNPTRVHLSAAQRSELIELRNSGAVSARFQAQAHAWTETIDGQLILVPTRDLLFFPSLLEIPAGETRRIRIASTVRPGAVERSYRMILDEFPGPGKAGTVQVLTRLSIPVFVQPAKPTSAPSVRADIVRGQVVISLTNTGNSYFKAASIKVVARSVAGEVLFEHSIPGWYMLAGAKRRYAVPLPPGACVKITSLQTRLRTEQGTLNATAAPPPVAACVE